MDRIRDMLNWHGDRVGDQVIGVIKGYDHKGRPVEFVVDTPLLRVNLAEQHDWIVQLDNSRLAFEGLVKTGVHPDSAWTLVQTMMPAPRSWPTAWQQMSAAVDDVVADGDDQMVKGGDDALGKPDD